MASLANGRASNCSCMSRQKWFFLLFVFIGFILMTATGLIVYYSFCIPTGVETEIICLPPAPATSCPAPPSNLPPCTSPPTCPPIAALPCPNSPAQTCRPCPTHPPCTTSNCQPFVCQAQPPTEIRPLTEPEMTNTRAFDLITRHPVNSYERLQVALQLMEFSIEWWANAFTVRNCIHDIRRVCTVCKDRYHYLRCIVENDLDSNKEIPKATRFVNEKYVNEPSNNMNHIYALNDRGNRYWFPEDIRRRAYHSAKEEQFQKYFETDVDMWKWGLRYDEYIPLQINQRALSFWIDKAGTPNRRHCTPCEGTNPLHHMSCTAYPHYLYEGGTRTTEYDYTWWPPHQL